MDFILPKTLVVSDPTEDEISVWMRDPVNGVWRWGRYSIVRGDDAGKTSVTLTLKD